MGQNVTVRYFALVQELLTKVPVFILFYVSKSSHQWLVWAHCNELFQSIYRGEMHASFLGVPQVWLVLWKPNLQNSKPNKTDEQIMRRGDSLHNNRKKSSFYKRIHFTFRKVLCILNIKFNFLTISYPLTLGEYFIYASTMLQAIL